MVQGKNINDKKNPYYKALAERGIYIWAKHADKWQLNPQHASYQYHANKDNKDQDCKYFKTLSEDGKWWRYYGTKWHEKGSTISLKRNLWPSKE